MTTQQKQQTKQQFLPSVDTLTDAKKAARQGVWASLFVVGMTSVMAVLWFADVQLFDISAMLFGIVLYALVAWGIYCMSRIAAIAGLILYIIDRIAIMSDPQVGVNGFSIGIAVCITMAFVNSIRGTFAYHRLRQRPQPEEPTTI